ncbi:hypothetical protein NEAUS06_0193 [Nematocida ausubeli]|nr:hypothetical protein NEAUS06_0193 [Nematocida ausubeli]
MAREEKKRESAIFNEDENIVLFPMAGAHYDDDETPSRIYKVKSSLSKFFSSNIMCTIGCILVIIFVIVILGIVLYLNRTRYEITFINRLSEKLDFLG